MSAQEHASEAGAPSSTASVAASRPGEPAGPAHPGARGLSLDALYVLLALVLTALFVLLRPIPPHDYYWHLAAGRWIAAHHAVPTVDVFSFTMAGRPFYDQPWLAQLVMFALHRAGGDALVLTAHAALVTLAYGLLLAAMTARAGRAHARLAATVLLVAIGPASCPGWNVRPQGFALPLFAAYVYALARGARPTGADASGARPSWRVRWRPLLLAGLMALWVNLHGSFVLGVALVALTLGGELVAHVRGEPGAAGPTPGPRALANLAATLALVLLATLANPRGPAVYVYVARLLGASAVTQLVTEWSATALRNVTDAWFYLVLAALVVALGRDALRPRPPDAPRVALRWSDLAVLAPFALLAVRASRNVVWFGMVAAPPLVAALAAWSSPSSSSVPRDAAASERAPANTLVALALGALLVPALPWARARLRLRVDPGLIAWRDTGAGAVWALAGLPPSVRPARLYAGESAGSYLTWALPSQPVFIDPRFELYPFAQWQDRIALGSGRDVDAVLARYRFDALLVLRARDAPLARELAARPRGFREVFRDRDALLLVRASGPAPPYTPARRAAPAPPPLP